VKRIDHVQGRFQAVSRPEKKKKSYRAMAFKPRRRIEDLDMDICKQKKKKEGETIRTCGCRRGREKRPEEAKKG